MSTSTLSIQEKMQLTEIEIQGEVYFKIAQVNELRPFLMSIVSSGNLWMFIASNGGLTAGRKNSEFALFPYETDDRLCANAEYTGSKTIIKIKRNKAIQLWEPFNKSEESRYTIERNLYKNKTGSKIIFEEINHDLQIQFAYSWKTSDKYGFVRTAEIKNLSESNIELEIIDGLQNLMTAGISSQLQQAASNLADAYKRAEYFAEAHLAVYALSAAIVDRADACEALKANVVWCLGINQPKIHLSNNQIDQFRKNRSYTLSADVKGEKGAFLIETSFELMPQADKNWMIVADVNLDQTEVSILIEDIKNQTDIKSKIHEHIAICNEKLIQMIAAADGLQLTGDSKKTARHFSNTMFNIMRGGIFDDNYYILKKDFKQYIFNLNRNIYRQQEKLINQLKEQFHFKEIVSLAEKTESADFIRLCKEYLPLKFSRRHGDPSRPWNKFTINTEDENTGEKILDYEGNWRDIFQNWEALAYSYPKFIEGMLYKFLNASTADGYNPYRVTKNGFDWETVEHDNPWSYIGYWGDHQIIYLLKFLEFIYDTNANYFNENLGKKEFVYANVPYRIKSYQDIVADAKDTIVFDEELDKHLRKAMADQGGDAGLLTYKDKQLVHAYLFEKLMLTALTKLSNFIPEAGIWLNTQRPEWNDANNALVGNGTSMVTLYYLRRYFVFVEKIINQNPQKEYALSAEVGHFFKQVAEVFSIFKSFMLDGVDTKTRKLITDQFGIAGSNYRNTIYSYGFSGKETILNKEQIIEFISNVRACIDKSIALNQREDKLFHSYNIIQFNEDNGIDINHLDEMLEGQTAVLSSGYLNQQKCVELLDAMRLSKLYREDQHSYLLYPNKNLSGFLAKNIIPKEISNSSTLLQNLSKLKHPTIVKCDAKGHYRFHADIQNTYKLNEVCKSFIWENGTKLTSEEIEFLNEVFEKVFNHRAFTGRSGTFFAYEGLGSIYWHMVSKLHLAAQENLLTEEKNEDAKAKLKQQVIEIGKGIGIEKSPSNYGAFPTDAYSHTPLHKGAQQPGMTGQVKEDIIVRFKELGLKLHDGKISFSKALIENNEWLKEQKTFNYYDVFNHAQSIDLKQFNLAFTICQVPIVYQLSSENKIEINYSSGEVKIVPSLTLDAINTESIFNRNNQIKSLRINFNTNH
jgi:hypothetical protein